ncbi:thioesterase family protein [Actinomadura decatromicini]|uniref:Thioesterase family protein n=1 Tax=Actinomadura decatromicini TaxID=2604572 RepID=A0A5D3FZY8_9ACTN|nr:thioesterase family protein [Actinomadura decatromicini]TYK53526.1 thioesterase family protein [Actinomadura decatromicini]
MSDDAPPAPAFYEPLGGGRFASTPATAGPWSPGLQHGGPVSGLIGRAFERHDPVPGTRVARVTVEILSPVPVAVLDVAVRVVRPGRRVAHLEGEVRHEGRTVVRATAWRILAAPERLEPVVHAPGPPPLPGATPPFGDWEDLHVGGYVAAMEWRPVEGHFTRPGPGTIWARPRVPLVAGEADTPLVRALTLADSASGVGSQLDLAKWLIINTDVTVALHRDPVGEWLCMAASLDASPGGSALCHATLADASGEFGRALQTMLVDDRPPD